METWPTQFAYTEGVKNRFSPMISLIDEFSDEEISFKSVEKGDMKQLKLWLHKRMSAVEFTRQRVIEQLSGDNVIRSRFIWEMEKELDWCRKWIMICIQFNSGVKFDSADTSTSKTYTFDKLNQ
jgi:hypothetical protein